MEDLVKSLTSLLRDVQKLVTVEYYRQSNAEVVYQLKLMNNKLAELSGRLDMGPDEGEDWSCHLNDCPNRRDMRKLKRKVMVLQDREYFAYGHLISGNLGRILGLVELVVMELKGRRYGQIKTLAQTLRNENERLRGQIEKILDGGAEGRD